MKKSKDKIALILTTMTGLGILLCLLSQKKEASAVSIIGGADGPTSIFIAGSVNAFPVYIGTAILALITAIYLIYRKKRREDK